MVDVTRSDAFRHGRSRSATLEYQIYFATTFLILLPVFLAARLLPRRWHPYPAVREMRRTPFGEARAAAGMIVPFVFMG